MNAWDRTPAGLMRRGTTAAGLATVEGPGDPRPRAEQYASAASEYRAAWESRTWTFQAPDGSTVLADNAGIRAEMRRLAGQGWTGCWIDAPEAGLPPAVLRPLYAGVIAGTARVGTTGPGGASTQYEQMIAESDYARTPWSIPSGSLARQIK